MKTKKFKVYIAERCYDYEGFLILGIFLSNKKAQECCDKDKDNGDDHCIQVMDINKEYI